jgi:hypothetical protein
VKPIDLQENPLVGAIAAIISKYGEINPDCNEDDVLEALAYVYASVERFNCVRFHPSKLN